MTEEKTGVTKNYNILPGIKMGVLSLDYLGKLVRVAGKHNVPFLKITSAQRLAIGGHSAADAEQIWLSWARATGQKNRLVSIISRL